MNGDSTEKRAFVRQGAVVTLVAVAYAALWAALIGDDVQISVFRHWFVAQDLVAALLFLACFWGALLVDGPAWITRFGQWAGERPVLLAVVALVVTGIGARIVYHDHALAMDEYAARLQAEIFASGRLVGSLPPELVDLLVPPVHQGIFVAVAPATGQIASVYLPGFALILAPFALLGVPWLCNPVLCALAVLVTHGICRRLYGGTTAPGWAMLLAIASPAFLGNAISYYSMTAHLVCNLGFVFLLLQRTTSATVLAGAIGGLAMVLHNPLPHLLFAAPWVMHLAWQRDWRRIVLLAAGYVPVFAVLGLGWSHVVAPLAAMNSLQAADMKALADRYPGVPPAVARLATVFTLPGVDTLEYRVVGALKVWLWAVPALPLLAWIGFRTRRQETPERLLLASAVLTFLGYLFVPFDQGHGWGYRYFHSAWGVLPILAAALWARQVTTGAPGAAVKLAPMLVLFSLAVLTPLRAWQMEATVAARLAQIPSYTEHGASLTFIDIDRGAFSADLVQNDPFLRRAALRMIAVGPSSNAALAHRWSPTARLVDRGPWGERWVPR